MCGRPARGSVGFDAGRLRGAAGQALDQRAPQATGYARAGRGGAVLEDEAGHVETFRGRATQARPPIERVYSEFVAVRYTQNRMSRMTRARRERVYS